MKASFVLILAALAIGLLLSTIKAQNNNIQAKCGIKLIQLRPNRGTF